MKNSALFSLILFLFILVPAKSQDYEMDKKFYRCIEESAALAGIDLEKAYAKFETEMIKNGLLKDSSGESYLALVQKLGETGEIPKSTEYLLDDEELAEAFDWLNWEMSDETYECMGPLLEDEDFMKSLVYKLDEALQTDDPEAKNEVAALWRATAKTVPAEAFTLDVMKMFVFAQYMIFLDDASEPEAIESPE